jgi:RNA polymerase sigma factor (sigma-70 family)
MLRDQAMAPAPLEILVRDIRKLRTRLTGPDRSDRELLESFLAHNDPRGFETLVARHGPMVLRVCRRVLGNAHDAEDAFQATFLLLAQQGTSIQKKGSLASWLHGVAHRIATTARRAAARRHKHELRRGMRQGPSSGSAETAGGAALCELQLALDEEVQALPAVYRETFVLCALEQRSCGEVAVALGLRDGTVRVRLSRARKLLERGLARRGIALTAALTATALTANGARAALPPALVSSTALAALHLATSPDLTAGLVSPTVAALVHGGTKPMVLSIIKTAALVLLSATLVAASLSLAAVRHARPSKPAAQSLVKGQRTDCHGDPLPAEALARLGTVRLRHSARITALDFSPDGKRIVSCGSDGIRVWKAASGQEMASVSPGAGGWLGGATLTSDGKAVVSTESGPNQFKVRLRDSATLKLLREFDFDRPDLLYRVSADGKFLATIPNGSDTTIELWDIASGKPVRRWQGHTRRIWAVQFTADGKTLLTAAEDKAIRFWEVPTGRQVREITRYPDIVGVLVSSPKGALLATVGMTEVHPRGVGLVGPSGSWPRQKCVRIWDVGAGKEVRRLTLSEKGGFGGVDDVAFAPNGKTLATSGPDTMVRFWDVSTGRELRQVTLGGYLGILRFSPGGDTLAVVEADKAIQLIDVARAKVTHAFGGLHSPFAIAVARDGRTVATPAGPGIVQFWDAMTGRERGQLKGHTGVPVLLGSSADGRTLLTRDFAGVVRYWDWQTGRLRHQFNPSRRRCWVFAVSPDGRAAAAMVDEDKEALALLEVASGKERHRLKGHGGRAGGSVFSPDGRSLVVWYLDRTARVWDVGSGRQVRQFRLAPQAWPGLPPGIGAFPHYPAAVSADGRLLACAGPKENRPCVTLYEVATGKEVRVLDNLPGHISALAVSRDGRMLAAGRPQHDPSVYLIEVATGQQRHVLRGHKGAILAMAFALDGRRLISTNEDTTALVWDLTGKLGAGGSWGKPLTPGVLEAAWTDLAVEDAGRAYKALRRLVSAPQEAIPYLSNYLRPVAVVPKTRLDRLITDLDNDEFAVRQQASDQLAMLGAAALPACRKALEGRPSLEARRRLEKLLQSQTRERWSPGLDRLRQMRALEALELMEAEGARQLLEKLAGGMPGAWLTEQAKDALQRRAGSARLTP